MERKLSDSGPAPRQDGGKRVQLNLRLKAEELRIIRDKARRSGLSLSKYIRACCLEQEIHVHRGGPPVVPEPEVVVSETIEGECPLPFCDYFGEGFCPEHGLEVR